MHCVQMLAGIVSAMFAADCGGGFGWCLVVFGGWVGGEPGLLVFDELGGGFADVADGFEG